MTQFILNGQVRNIAAEPGRTVLEHLRLHEHLTATKEGCAEGDCGACTVAIGRRAGDGLKFSAVNSCIMPATALDGCVVITAEGLEDSQTLSPVQQALVASHASQCGFCTPGFTMSLFALTQDEGGISEKAVLDALAGNLCRCTGYRPILAAAASLHQEPDPRIPAWRAALDELPRASTAPQSLEALATALAANPEARLIAGGTDIGVGIAKFGQVPGDMISVREVPELKKITEEHGGLTIGAAATYSEILPYLDRHFPNFSALIRRIGAAQIRNLGTMGGNLCNASPIGDCAPCLIALGATLHLYSAQGERTVSAAAFFTAYRKTALLPGEFLQEIEIPFLKSDEVFFAYKLAKRFDQDISTLAAAFKLRIDHGIIRKAHCGFGGMAATPVRAHALEVALAGQPADLDTFTRVAEKIPEIFSPISDFRGSAAYRNQAAAGLLRRLGAQLTAPAQPTDIWAL